MRSRQVFAGLALACGVLLFATPAAANERQTAAPVWGEDDDGFPATSAFQMIGLDFDLETPGLELADEEFFSCAIVPESGGMIRVRYVVRVRFRDPSDGSVAYVTDDLQMRSQPFPDPFDPLNQDMDENLLYAYLTREGDVTSQLQSAVLMAADPFEVLCDQETFPSFGPFGIAMAQGTTIPTRGAPERTLIFGDALTGAVALKGDPLNPFWDFVHPQEGIGTAKYWTIEASVGAIDKGTVLSSRSFAEQADFFEATPDWGVDFEMSLVGDMLGTGDLIRITELKQTVTPGIRNRRVRHFNVRTGALEGTVVQHTVVD